MPFTFDAIQAFDPTDPKRVAADAEIIIHAPNDPNLTPIEITDVTGIALPNPYLTNDLGSMPAFVSYLERVAWTSGDMTNFLTSWEGLRDAAEAARVAAEEAAVNSVQEVEEQLSSIRTAVDTSAVDAKASAAAAIAAAGLVDAPPGEAVKAAIGPGGAAETELLETFVPPQGQTPGDPAPAFRGDPAGGDLVDSTKRVVLESYQRPERGPWGESLRFLNRTPQAKTMLSWYHPENPDLPYDQVTNPMHPKADVWVGAHWAGQTDGTGIHGHWSVETPMANGDLYSRFGIDFVDHDTKTRGKDVTHAYFANTDLTHRQGDGAVFRIAAGPGSAERRIEFNASGFVADGGPGQIDETKRRWWIVADQTAETGGDKGTNFYIRSFNDDGSSRGVPFFIDRQKGNATFGEASSQWAQVSARGEGAKNHSFQSVPKASPANGFAHYAAVAVAVTDRMFDLKVSGDANSRFATDANGKMEWGDGIETRDTMLYRAAANILETPGWFSLGGRLLLSSAHGGFMEMKEQSAPPARPSSKSVRLFAQDNGSGKTQLVAMFGTGAYVPLATQP